MQDSQCQGDHLQIFAPGRSGDVSRLGADIVDNGLLEPWDQKVGALVNHCLLDSR